MTFDVRHGSEVGVVVRDLAPVLDLYEEGLGLGPFTRDAVDVATGDGGVARIERASAPLGRCEMELIEVTAGRPPHAEFLDARGEGMNHFNLDKGTAEAYLDTLGKLYWRGIEPFWGLPWGSFCYVESEGIGGVTFEVMIGSGHAGKKGQHHVGLVVENTKRTIDYYHDRIGLPDFRTGAYPMPRAVYRDARIDVSFKASFCDIGESRLVLYAVPEGATPLGERLASEGEGMHHLCLRVPDVDASLEAYAARGVEPVWRSPELDLALLDTRGIGGMTFALTTAD